MFDNLPRFPMRLSAVFAYGFAALLAVFVGKSVRGLHPEMTHHLTGLPIVALGLHVIAVLVALCLGRLHRQQFGRPGRWGLLRSWLATVDIALLTAAFVGALILPLAGAMYGPLLLGLTLVERPVVLALVLAAATLGHVARARVTERRVSL